jgi:hypothetical protein
MSTDVQPAKPWDFVNCIKKGPSTRLYMRILLHVSVALSAPGSCVAHGLLHSSVCIQAAALKERRALVLPWLRWAFGLLWAVLLELVHIQQALTLEAAETRAAQRGLIRMLHESACAQLVERLMRNLNTCKVCIDRRLNSTGPS